MCRRSAQLRLARFYADKDRRAVRVEIPIHPDLLKNNNNMTVSDEKMTVSGSKMNVSTGEMAVSAGNMNVSENCTMMRA